MIKFLTLFVIFNSCFASSPADELAAVKAKIVSQDGLYEVADVIKVIDCLYRLDLSDQPDGYQRPIHNILGPLHKVVGKMISQGADANNIPWDSLLDAWLRPEVAQTFRIVEGDVLDDKCFVEHFKKSTIPLPTPEQLVEHGVHGGLLGPSRLAFFVHDLLHSRGIADDMLPYAEGLTKLFEKLQPDSECNADTINWILAMYIHELGHGHNIFQDVNSERDAFDAMCNHLERKFLQELQSDNKKDNRKKDHFVRELALTDALYQSAAQSCLNTKQNNWESFAEYLQAVVIATDIKNVTFKELPPETGKVLVGLNGNFFKAETLTAAEGKKLRIADVVRDMLRLGLISQSETLPNDENVAKVWKDLITRFKNNFSPKFSETEAAEWVTQLQSVKHKNGDNHTLIPVIGCEKNFREHERGHHNHDPRQRDRRDVADNDANLSLPEGGVAHHPQVKINFYGDLIKPYMRELEASFPSVDLPVNLASLISIGDFCQRMPMVYAAHVLENYKPINFTDFLQHFNELIRKAYPHINEDVIIEDLMMGGAKTSSAEVETANALRKVDSFFRSGQTDISQVAQSLFYEGLRIAAYSCKEHCMTNGAQRRILDSVLEAIDNR